MQSRSASEFDWQMRPQLLNITDIIVKKSVLLLGPRQVGKSTLLRHTFPNAPTYNLLDASVFRTLTADPTQLRREVLAIRPKPPVVIIDEVQRLPELMNEAHLMIEEHGLRFVLTGSSARALRRRGVNLLAGRARTLHLHPLVSAEVKDSFDLKRALNHGLMPAIYDSDDPDADLADYSGTYLREEVAAEGLTRNIPAFSRFLEVAAARNGHIINHTNIAGDAAVKRTTVIDYFQILRDTLTGYDLEPWVSSRKRKAVATSKFYLFDLGVARHLSGAGELLPRSPGFGAAFEHFIFLELKAAIAYRRASSLHYWRSTSGFEVDFLLDETLAIKVKASSKIQPSDLKGIKALCEENKKMRGMVVAMVERPAVHEDIMVLPWQELLQQLWAGNL